MVGAWFASRLASGELGFDCLVPEGFDDLQLEAAEPVQVEVKSRQRRMGPFPVGEAASRIVDAWLRHMDRFGNSRRLVVVLEQGILGLEDSLEQPITEVRLSQIVEEVHGFGDSLAAHVSSRGRPPSAAKDMEVGTTVLICSWDGLVTETERQLGLTVNLPAAALGVIARSLQILVADAVDANSQARLENRVALDRTSIVAEVNAKAELIDLESLDYALAQGICGPIDKEPLEIGDSYYEGVSTQPGHVAAGLVIPRPALVSQAIAHLDMNRAVLFVGPSGVGKSAVLWMLAFALPGVLWFRVNQMSAADVPHVMRLLRAQGTSPKAPVGLLVDAAGSGDLEGWSRLRKAVATVPGALLAGTARNEDLFSLGDLADSSMVSVSLDENAAAAIHAGLTRRGATTVPHWQEAFQQSHGLTLEFTHLLTQGTRLNDVLSDQVNTRIREGRALELRILTLVASADRWSASIPTEEVGVAVSADPLDVRAALNRLIEEHLLVERDGFVSGIHQIRSRSLVDAIHKVPPPKLEETVAFVLSTLRGPSLSRFVYEVLREVPSLEGPVLQTLDRLAKDDVDCLIACLHGLELLDFYRQATAWAQIAERHDVPLAHRSIALYFAITGIAPPDIISAPIRNAFDEMISLSEQSGTRNALLSAVGPEGIAVELTAATSADACLRLLVPFGRASADWTPLLAALEPSSSFVAFLKDCPLPALGDCVSSARDISVGLAREFVEAVGGVDALLGRFRNSEPWLQELEVVVDGGERVGFARFLYVSESEQGDAQERAHEIGRQLLRMLPDLNRVDVKAVLPGGGTLRHEDTEYGSSRLQREFDHHPVAVRWNRERIRLAQNLFASRETERLTEADGLISETARLVRDFGNAFMQMRGGPDRTVDARRIALHTRGQQLPPRFGRNPFSDEGDFEMSDPLSSVITHVCGNALPRFTKPEEYVALVAFVNETVLGKDIAAAKAQPWKLIGYEDAPLALEELTDGLSDIVAVLTELRADPSSLRKIVNAARSGNARGALARAAKLSRQSTTRRVEKRRSALRRELESTGWAVEVFWSDEEPTKGQYSNFAVTVALDSLAQWQAATDELVPRLRELRDPTECPLLVPLLERKSIPALAVRLISSVFPTSDLGEFEELLPEKLEQRLTTSVSSAYSALQICSGLSVLNRGGILHEQLCQVRERTLSDYNDAIGAIRGFGEDAVLNTIIDWFGEMRERVENEWQDETEAGAFAVDVVTGALEGGSLEIIRFVAVLLLSLQWDSEPAAANAVVASLG